MSEAKVREVYPGVFVIHLPLPMRPTIVNVTLLHSGDEWALVDTGVSTSDSIDTLRAALQQVGCAPEKIGKLLGAADHRGVIVACTEILQQDPRNAFAQLYPNYPISKYSLAAWIPTKTGN